MKTYFYLGAIALVFLVVPRSLAGDVPCDSEHGPSGWRVYVDHKSRFCFQYPPTYKIRHDPNRRHGMIVDLNAEGGDILVWFDQYPFGEQRFEELSRSGNPPEVTKIGQYTFRYNGPGGGGVDYSDDYLFNLHGKLLHIEFDGPYIEDNHPPPKVRELEPKLLATFRVF